MTLIADARARRHLAVMARSARSLGMEESVMRAAQTSGQDRDAERDLVGELARVVVGRVAPEELGLFEETEADYFRDPRLTLKAGARDEAVGFGLDMALLTPYVLVAGVAVVRFLAAVVSDAVRDEVRDELKPVIAGRIRRLLRRDDLVAADRRQSGERDRAPGVTVEQAREVRRVAVQQAKQCGLDDEKATLLADAFVGALLVNG
jgi:hypothetical protein